MKPKILMTARDDSSSYNGKRQYHNFVDYFTYVSNQGGIPHMIGTNLSDIDEIMPYFDGLLLTGGDDVNPSLYNEENQKSAPCASDLEEMDIALYQAFKAANKPIFGICRGIQIMNVIEGGTLIQDIPSYSNELLEHNQIKAGKPDDLEYHQCTCMKDSLLGSLLGEKFPVNSYHHQAIKDLAPFFKATCFSEDGLVEGIEHEQIFAVQWHPERMQAKDNQLKLMHYFIECCAKNSL